MATRLTRIPESCHCRLRRVRCARTRAHPERSRLPLGRGEHLGDEIDERAVAGVKPRAELVQTATAAGARIDARAWRVALEVDQIRRLAASLDEEPRGTDPLHATADRTTQPAQINRRASDGHSVAPWRRARRR